MEKIKIGTIVNTHGIKGELKVAFDDDSLFVKGMKVYVEFSKQYKEFTITNQRMHKNHLLITLDDYNNINDVEKYKTCDIYVDRSEDEIYYSDLIGYSVVNNGNVVGKVLDIINNNAHDIFVLDNDIMIPYVDEFIEDINDDKKEIAIKVIAGLIDED